ncbi:uncharacterized protein LOC121866384 isoform X2 [Homarus americanus]|nr:uncharacterized protein LOC121866384 isoform X2 [Homarus americanus]
MQGVSIIGLVFAMASLANCAAGLAGIPLGLPGGVLPLTLELPDLRMALSGIEVDKVNEEGQLNVIKKRVIDILKEKYKQELEKKRRMDTILMKEEMEENKKKEEVDSSILPEYDNATLGQDLSHSRKKREVVPNLRIPTLLGHVPGPDDQRVDPCERDEILAEDGDCYEVLSQGPCEDNDILLMDPYTRKGFCGPRLCAPDRVFVFSDQQCHDPREYGICPPGRQLFTTSYGTPVCGCPDGTYEEDDDLDDDVCEPVLGHISNCPPGQVFWFDDFRNPPVCRPDPCKGLNLKRGPEDLPYVPALKDGKCYQVGSKPAICSSDQYYSLSLELLRGVCSSLEDAGYLVLDSDAVQAIVEMFGSLLPREDSSSSTSSTSSTSPSSAKPYKKTKTKTTPAGTYIWNNPKIGQSVVPPVEYEDDDEESTSAYIGAPVVANHHPAQNEVDGVLMFPTHMSAFSAPFVTVNGSITILGFLAGLVPMSSPMHHRERRSPLPFASPGNVFEPGLSACRAGAKRDGNAKCRSTILPSRYPPSRPRRAAPPVPPATTCASGFWGLKRSCTSSASSIASSINALGLG